MTAKRRRGFASDNNAGIHPALLESMAAANSGHVVAYGDDEYTRRAEKTFKEYFGESAEVFFVLTGTGANVLSLASFTRSFNSVICAETAHIQVDECGAPEKFTQCKLLPVVTRDGKLTVDGIKKHLHGFGFEHHAQPRVISISQPTEMGTVYTPSEIRSLADLAHQNNMILHMDGARLANAAVSLGLPFKAFTTDPGVDVLSFGGTKNGMLFGESVVFLKPGMSGEFKYLRKQGMQLASKMRYISAQFEAYLSQKVWYTNALHANKMAQLLYEKTSAIPGIKITQKVQANAVFAIIPANLVEILQEKYFFYVWDEHTSEVRWMTSFDTTEEDIEGFSSFLASKMSSVLSAE
jgi:threonine aldolase